jgi:DNA-binding PadR family transcriptional regulator
MKKLSNYEQTLLDGWEDVHKKGQLSLWILLALKQGPKHMATIKAAIADLTADTIVPDDKSMYRALRRFHDAELVHFKHTPSQSGPDLKIYSLSEEGSRVLSQFLHRNVINVFYKPKVRTLIEKGAV